jgi:hypothetical protein
LNQTQKLYYIKFETNGRDKLSECKKNSNASIDLIEESFQKLETNLNFIKFQVSKIRF